jgi:hypothetical protein
MANLRSVLRPVGKYFQSVARWKRLTFNDVPPIFGNAKPKSGSHLLLQILGGFTQIAPYVYVEEQPVRTVTKEGRRRSAQEIVSDLKRIPRGVIGWGYLDPTPENTAFLCQPDRVNYFIFRDPRDMLISHVFYATDMHEGHGMHEYYKALPDFNARLDVAITGIDRDGLFMVGVRQRYDAMMPWLGRGDVLAIRYEDLINNRDATLHAMLDQVEKTGYKFPVARAEAIAALVEIIQPRKSKTFRAGKTGTWREYFTEAHKKLFKDLAGNLLVELGYEQNNDW